MPNDTPKKVSSWDEEVVDVAPKKVDSWDEETTDEPVKKKVVTTPSESPSQKFGGGFMPPAKDLEEVAKPLSESGIKNESLSTYKKSVDDSKDFLPNNKTDKSNLSNDELKSKLLGGIIPSDNTEDARGEKVKAQQLNDKLITKEEQKAIQVDESKKPTTLQDAYKSKISTTFKLAEEHKNLSSDYAKNYNIAEVAQQDPNVVKLNNLILQRDNAIQNNEGQKVADLSSEIESLKNAPVDTPTDIQQVVAQSNAQNQGAPQDTPDFRSGFTPKTINQKLVDNGVKPVKTVGELAEISNLSQQKMAELKKPIDETKGALDAIRKDENIGVNGLDENGVKVREGVRGAIPAFIDGFVNTSKSMLQGLEYLDATLKGDDTKKIELAKQRWVEENILHPTENKGAIANASNMLGGVAPYALGGAVLGEAEIVPRMIMDATGMGLSDVGNGYYEGFAKMKDEGKSDEEANDYATKKMAYEGVTGAMLGAGLPHISNGSSKIFGVAKDEKTVRKFLADGFGMTTAFTGRKLLGNAYEKYGLGNENVKLSEGLQETAEGALMLHGLMHVLPKAPKVIKDIYDVTIARQFPNIEKRFARGVEKGEITQEQADAVTVPLKKKFAIYNAMPEGLTAEQMVSIKPETEQILELSKKEPSAVENPEITKDRIAQLQKTIAEKLGTPLTEKEQKSYEKLQEVKADKEDKLTPSEKSELKHYENRIATAENEKAKLAEEKKAEKEKEVKVEVGVVEDAEYNDFIDKGKVSEERLNDIANKVKNQEPLSDRENEIFSDKTGEINKIIATQAGSVGVGGDVDLENKEKDLTLQNGKEKQGNGISQIKGNSEKVQYNGTDAIGQRSRPESEKAASRKSAKEKINNPETNASLQAANDYNKSAGIPEIQPHEFKPSDKEAQSKIGETYKQLQDVTSPTYKETELERQIFDSYKSKHPELFEKYGIKSYKDLVEKSYAELVKETNAQFEALPIKVEFHEGDHNYESSAEMLDDVHNFGHLWVFKGGDDHTLLGSKTADKNGITANDKFRGVHDYFGHSIEGYEFGKNGEENAWIEHSKMFSPLAQIALSSETRGQNSFVNYSGVNDVALEKMKTAAALTKKGLSENNSEMIAVGKALLNEANNEFQFAEQKSIVLPEKYTNAEQSLKETTKEQPIVAEKPVVENKEVPKVEAKPEKSVFQLHEETKGASKKDKVIEEYAKANPEKANRVQEIIDNFDTMKQQLTKLIDEGKITNLKIEC